MNLADEMLSRYAEWFVELLRDVNSAFFVLNREVPDWRRKYDEARASELLNEKVDRIAALNRFLVEYVLGHQEANPEFLEQLDRLRRALRERPQ